MIIIRQKQFTRKDQAILKELKKATGGFKKLPKLMRKFDLSKDDVESLRGLASKITDVSFNQKSKAFKKPISLEPREIEALGRVGLTQTSEGIEHLVNKYNNNEIRNRYLRIRRESTSKPLDKLEKSTKKNFERSGKKYHKTRNRTFENVNQGIIDNLQNKNVLIEKDAGKNFFTTFEKHEMGGIGLVKGASTAMLAHEGGHAIDQLNRSGLEQFRPIKDAKSKKKYLRYLRKDLDSNYNIPKKIKRRIGRKKVSLVNIMDEYVADVNAKELMENAGASKRQIRIANRSNNRAINTYITNTPRPFIKKSRVNYKIKKNL